MRTLVALVFFCLLSRVFSQYDSEESAASFASPEVPDASVSSEEVVDTDESQLVVVVEGSGSSEEDVNGEIHVLGILPGPGDIRKKRNLMDVLSRK